MVLIEKMQSVWLSLPITTAVPVGRFVRGARAARRLAVGQLLFRMFRMALAGLLPRWSVLAGGLLLVSSLGCRAVVDRPAPA